ncbi:bloom syndrome protein [Capronia epimyces CBS 606.96]|uniref:RecQ-like DNA helicase BLM n=1 Tax=Capronia epimyces CBS 606.96 TaxID=1182542 RepID=W9YKF3_9EURO|nr:bloom syndrome protein [Capronia epimyces CBS 606.96]EXJ93033.1 bloom syndrome protein [Capronia epimyces CBS 606.96]
MTKNNLSRCLAWLLQNPHSFGSLTHISAVADAGIGDDDEPVLADDEMARLQLAPQIQPRTKLLSQLNHTSGLPTPDPSRASETCEPTRRRARQNILGPSKTQPSPRPRTPVTSFDDIKFDDSHDILDIDDIDLAAEDLTTSSFGDFGPPIPLWREDSATRVEPLPKKKGKKRKSEEFHEDLFSPRSARSTKKRLDKRSPPKTYPFRASQTQASEGDHIQAEVGLSPATARIVRKPVKEEDIFPDVDIGEIPDDPVPLQPLHPTTDRTWPHLPPQQSRVQRIRNVVPDSDDEDNFGLELKPKRKPVESTDLEFEDDLHHHAGGSQTFARESNHPPRASGYQEAQGSLLSSQKSPTRSPKALLLSQSSPKRDNTLQGSCSSIDSTGLLAQEQRRVVGSFVVNGREQCKGLLERLEKSKKTVNRQIMDEMCEFNVVSDALKEKKKTIATKITAATQLLEEHSSISRLQDQRRRMLERRDELEEAGHEINPDDPENVLALLCMDINRVKHEIEAREVVVFQLLQQAGVSTTSDFTEQASLGPSVSGSLLDDMSGQQVLVASTPKVNQQMSPYSKELGHLSTQSVVQTPFAKRSDTAHLIMQASAPIFSPACSPTRTVPSAMPPPSVRPLQPTSQVPESPNRNRSMLYEYDPGDDRSFTRTMGSPRDLSFEEDDFEDDMDDEEMYKMMEEIEQNMPAFKSTPHESNRAALSEVSDNPRRVAPKKPASTHGASSNSALMQHPWSKDVASALKKRFHLHGFRQNQLEAINATLSGKDAFVLMPTGGGKSLCYQLPSIVHSGHTRGVTIVISPLLSLMQDQVDHLHKLRIQAFLINGQTTAEHRSNILQRLKNPNAHDYIQLLYVTPEMVGSNHHIIQAFESLYKRRLLARIVIDEAHCVSQWGHDFRPDYKALGEFRARFPNAPIMALTATATENVKFDVIQCLGMEECEIFTQSFNRPNLTYEVRKKGKGKAVLESIADTINRSYEGQAGIVYCLSRKHCEQVAEQLCKDYGIEAHHYHAGLPSEERIDIQKKWQAGDFKVIVATIAFGMGIDKPDVRFVIHHTIPKSLEGYYQETGRAGRDGNRSGCYLYYGYGDTASLIHMIDTNENSSMQQKEHQRSLLRNVVQFCENRSDCRRFQVLDYFNERFDPRDCRNGCDNCASSSTFETHDFSEHAHNAIRLVQQISRDNVTVLHCADLYRGGKPNRKMLQCGHDQLREYGLGAELERGDVERLFYRLIMEDALMQYNKKNDAGFATQCVQVGPKSHDFLEGRRPLKIQVLVSPRGKPSAKVSVQKSRNKTPKTVGKPPADDYPASTNVSSPLQPRSRRKLVRGNRPLDSEEEAFAGQSSDNEEIFIPQRGNKKSAVGPPITADDDIGSLNEIHQHILEDFVEKAKKEVERQVIAKGLRQKPVTDRVLRQIAIQFPQSQEELQELTGLNPEMFRRLGPPLLRLITAAYDNYEAMMRAQEGRPDDPNHQTVVEISDDDAETGRFLQSDMDADESEDSHYFSIPDEVRQFNEQSPIEEVPVAAQTGVGIGIMD